MFVLIGRTAAWKANCIYGEPSAEAARGKRRKHDKFLYILIFWYVATVIFKQTSTSLGQRESSSGGNGDSTPRQITVMGCILGTSFLFFSQSTEDISLSNVQAWMQGRGKPDPWNWHSALWQGCGLGTHAVHCGVSCIYLFWKIRLGMVWKHFRGGGVYSQ